MAFFDGDETFAALDLGTTNCRLLIARPQGQSSLRIVDSFSRVVRLGEGLDATGVLSEPAMARAVDALIVCAAKARARGVTRRRFVATEACRRASNCGAFMQRVRSSAGIDLEIIPTEEEARLALVGCSPLLDAYHRNAIVFDIGGGSTEVMWIELDRDRNGRTVSNIEGMMSLPHGVVSLTERFADLADPRAAFQAMVALLTPSLERFGRQHRMAEAIGNGLVQMMGSSGTVTTLAAMNLGLPRYSRSKVDGVSLDFTAIATATEFIIGTDSNGRAGEPCIGASRADLMVAGCAILSSICRTWPVGRLRVADRGVREGILSGLVEGWRRERERTVEIDALAEPALS